MHPVASAGALIGRDNEMELLTRLAREAACGRGSSVLVEGEPGIGKSTLVRAAAAAAREAGCEVFWGAGDELPQAMPLLPFLDGLRVRDPSANSRRMTIARILRGEVSADGADMSAVLAEQLLALVAEECSARPTLLVIDDLQWADQATVGLWARLARSARQMPLLLAGIMRAVPQRDDVLALRRMTDDVACLRLAGLTAAAMTDLVAVLAGGKPDDNLLQLAEGAAGNPLYLTELVAALVRSASLTITDAGTAIAEPGGGSAPHSLSAAIADRLDFVTGPVREVLRAAALLGADFAVADLALVLERSVTDLLPALDEARAAGVLAESGGGLGFRHPLIRAALYYEMPASWRAAWHRDAGRAFAAAGASPDRVARQVLRAVSGSHSTDSSLDDWMVEWLVSVSDLLVGQAPQVAAELLDRAVTSSPADSARHGLLASRLADALYRTGNRVKAEQVAGNALEHVDQPDVLVDLHWTLVQCRMRSGSAEESLATLTRALVAPGTSVRHRARLLVLVARAHAGQGEVAKASQFATSALEEASKAGDTWAMAWALHVLTIVTGSEGRLTDALPLFDRALAVSESDPRLADLRLLLQLNKALALGSLDRHEEGLAVARQARDLADRVGTVIRLGQAHGALAQVLFLAGSWDDALAEVQVIHPSLLEPGGACADLGIAAVIRFHRGEVGAARRHLAAAVPYAEQLGHRLVSPLVLARSLDREHDGALPEAFAVVAAVLDGSQEALDEVEALLPDAVRLANRIGDLEAAQDIARLAIAHAAGSEIPHCQADALYCRGLVDHETSQLLAAAERYGDAGRPLQRAQALEAAAREFVSAGDVTPARAAFNRAVEVYTVLGAAADVARLEAEFRAHGIRRGPHARHRQASSGWASLTPTEVKIVAYVEEGLSNPEIAAQLVLSPRTVATHVSHILRKLGVQSRIDIARESVLHAQAPR
jgi:DNA-binding CsgD family transcriptional regulator/tetratricopeptide (TPR) repeat protein